MADLDPTPLTDAEQRDLRAAYERDKWAGEWNSIPTAVDRIVDARVAANKAFVDCFYDDAAAHFREAERLIDTLKPGAYPVPSGAGSREERLALAQVHATLAIAATQQKKP